MNFETQVSALTPSRLLKDFGVKQESCFYWFKTRGGEFRCTPYSVPGFSLEGIRENLGENCSAFTVAELGEKLPPGYVSVRVGQDSRLRDHPAFTDPRDEWLCYGPSPVDMQYLAGGQNEAEARAKMLVYLIENNLVEVPK